MFGAGFQFHTKVSFPKATVHILNQLHLSITVSHVYVIVKYSVIILSSVACKCVGGCICMCVPMSVSVCVCVCVLEHVHVLLYVCFTINNWQYEY